MDVFLARIFFIVTQTSALLWIYTLILCGGVLGSYLIPVRFALRRVLLLWWLSGVSLVLALSDFWFLAIPAAAEAGLFSLAIIAGFGLFMMVGALLWCGYAARSNHIRSDTSRGWMGFVPFLNLWLMLGRGQDGAGTPPHSKRARILRDPVLVLLALASMIAIYALRKEQGQRIEAAFANSRALGALYQKTLPLSEAFHTVAQDYQSLLPIRYEAGFILRKVIAEREKLRLIYSIDGVSDGDPLNLQPEYIREKCSEDQFGYHIARGGILGAEFFAPTGRFLAEFPITQAQCDHPR